MCITGVGKDNLLPESEKQMNKFQQKGKKSLKEAKKTNLGDTFRKFGTCLDTMDGKTDKEKVKIMESVLVRLAKKGVNVMHDVKRAEEYYHSRRSVSEEVIQRQSRPERWDRIPAKKDATPLFGSMMCDYKNASRETVKQHMKEYHMNTYGTVVIFFFILCFFFI